MMAAAPLAMSGNQAFIKVAVNTRRAWGLLVAGPSMTFGKARGGGRRGAPRAPAPLTAIVVTVGGSRCHDLVDLSASGARLEGEALPRLGHEVIVTIEQVRAYGRVVWSEYGQCGIEFDEAIPAAAVQALQRLVAKAAGVRREFNAAMDDWATGMVR